MRNLLIALSIFTLIGCCPDPLPPIIQRETVEVKVPIPVKMKLPESITSDVEVELPVFYDPKDPEVTSGLTPEGEKRLKKILITLKDLRAAVKAWDESE